MSSMRQAGIPLKYDKAQGAASLGEVENWEAGGSQRFIRRCPRNGGGVEGMVGGDPGHWDRAERPTGKVPCSPFGTTPQPGNQPEFDDTGRGGRTGRELAALIVAGLSMP